MLARSLKIEEEVVLGLWDKFQQQFVDFIMRSNFVPAFIQPRKDQETMQRSSLPAAARLQPHHFSNIQRRDLPEEPRPSSKTQPADDDNSIQDQSSSFTVSETGLRNYQQPQVRPREHVVSPIKRQQVSPKPNNSPAVRNSRLQTGKTQPVRTTLKHLMVRADGDPQSRLEDKREGKMSTSFRFNRTITDVNSPNHGSRNGVERQNQLLREENALLRSQLNQIKQRLLFGAGSRKEEIISNLRDTIKKEDNEIKQLRLKLEILAKKNGALTSICESKDEQIRFLTSKMAQMEIEIAEHRHRNSQRMELLKQKIALVVKSYGELETKHNRQEMEWLVFKEKWVEQKSMYLDRIQFLEQYIAQSD